MFAAEAVGVAQRALDLAVEYAGVRTQFGRPIGSYQAVSHRLADAAVGVQLARSLAYRAAWCVQTDSADADDAVLYATVAARNGALGSCESAVQTFGGIGFTWAHPLHRLYRRARWIAAFDGATTAYRAELAALLIDQAPPTTRRAPTAAAAPAPSPPPAPSTLAVGGRPSPR
jgi:alkylation response protein AidB-like acyl-CoA dehydrogenase